MDVTATSDAFIKASIICFLISFIANIGLWEMIDFLSSQWKIWLSLQIVLVLAASAIPICKWLTWMPCRHWSESREIMPTILKGRICGIAAGVLGSMWVAQLLS